MSALGLKVETFFPVTGYLLEQLARKDHTTYAHSLHVARVATILAAEMGLSGQERLLFEAGLLHDIGKLHIPDELLSSRKVFTPKERTQMERHVEYTRRILLHHHYPPLLINICVQHHERLDGSGYPQGLKKDRLSSEAMLLAVADVFAALVSPRPYRGALSPRQAASILSQESLAGRLPQDILGALLRSLEECYEACRTPE